MCRQHRCSEQGSACLRRADSRMGACVTTLGCFCAWLICEKHGQFAAFGSGHAIVAYPIVSLFRVPSLYLSPAHGLSVICGLQRGTEDIAFQFYAPDGGQVGKYGDKPSVDVLSVVDEINPEYGSATLCPNPQHVLIHGPQTRSSCEVRPQSRACIHPTTSRSGRLGAR